jgi:hypothetical protein
LTDGAPSFRHLQIPWSRLILSVEACGLDLQRICSNTSPFIARLLLHPPNHNGGSAYEPVSVFAYKWLCLRWIRPHPGGACPCRHVPSGRVAHIRSRHKSRIAEAERSEPHLASGSPHTRHALSTDTFQPFHGIRRNGQADEGQNKRARNRVRELSAGHRTGADAV